MFTALLFSLGLAVLLILAVGLIGVGDRQKRSVLSPAELEKFEIEPTVRPLITEDNVDEVINWTIENGEEHPLLAARKAESL